MKKQGVTRKDWFRIALAVLLSAVLIAQGIPVQAIAEEATDPSTPAMASNNEPEATTSDQADDAPVTEPAPAPVTETNATDEGGDAANNESVPEEEPQPDGEEATTNESDDEEVPENQSDDEEVPENQSDGEEAAANKPDDQTAPENKPAAPQAPANKPDDEEAPQSKSDGEEAPQGTTDGDENKNEDKDEGKDETPAPSAIDFSTITANGVIVMIHAPEGAFPAGTTPVVRPVDASALMAAASDLVEGEPVDGRAVDICFMKDEAEVEPAEGTSVTVLLRLLAPVTGETFQAVHLDDYGIAEVVDENATKFGASFDAKEFSVYGIVGGSVERGPEEEYTRLKVVFRNSEQEGKDGAIVSTQIVHEGDQINAPDVTPNVATQVKPDEPDEAVPYPTFKAWMANGIAVDAAYFGVDLTEDDIQGFISAYGVAKSSTYDNLYEVTLVADYEEEGYRAYFHRYTHREDAEASSYNGVILGSLATTNKQVNLGEFKDRYVPPTENDKLIGWNVYDMHGKPVSIGGKELFSTTDTVTLTDDTDFYPVLAEGVSVTLEMNGATPLDNAVAVYDEATQKNVLELSDLPDAVSAANYYPGYEFDGWYTDSSFTTQITESTPAIFEPGTTNAKVYAKWNPNDKVSYKIAFLAEDETGKPGEGNFSVYKTESFEGTAGEKIPEEQYKDESLDGYHHLVKQGEIDGDELYTLSTADTYIKGDGSTIKLVYYTYNRIKFTCTRDTDSHTFANFFPDEWVKPGESIETWLGAGGFSNQPYCNYISMSTSENGAKKYVQDNKGYVFDGTQTAIPYVSNNCADTTIIDMVASSGTVWSKVIGQYFYECVPGESTEGKTLTTATVTVNGEPKTLQFYLDHKVEWGTFAKLNEHPDETFGNTAQGGGLYELAYKAMHTDLGNAESVRDLPEDRIQQPGKISSAERYNGDGGKYYYDHYYVRARSNLTFWDAKGATPNDPIQAETDVLYGKQINTYLPEGYIKDQTTCEYGGNTYTFVGWYTDSVAAENPDEASSKEYELKDDATMPKSNQDIYAGWRIKGYNVTFDAMGGKFAGGEMTLTVNVESGKRVQRPDDPTRDNEEGEQPYVFSGWYKDQDYAQSWSFDTDVVHDDTTIYARWYHEKTWILKYYDAEGNEKASWADRLVEGATVHLDAPEQSTYNGEPFLGWALHVGDGESDDDYRIVPNTFTIVDVEDQQVVKLYARYGNAALIGAPTVTFHSNYPDQEGEGETSTALADPETPNGQVTLPDYTTLDYTRPKGYKFIGWGTSADGSGMIYAAGQPVGVSGEPGENTDLYAIWEYHEYTIRFVNDDGTELQSDVVPYGEMPEYMGETPTKAEDDQYTYAFAGWEPTIVEATEDATYTATYTATPKTATLTFDLAGGKLDGKTGKVTMTAKIGETVKLLRAPTRDGYTFKYWKGSQYNAEAEYKVEGDHTFTAVWEKSITPTPQPTPGTTPAAKAASKSTQQSRLAGTSDATTVAPMAALAAVGITAIALGWRKRRQSEV